MQNEEVDELCNLLSLYSKKGRERGRTQKMRNSREADKEREREGHREEVSCQKKLQFTFLVFPGMYHV